MLMVKPFLGLSWAERGLLLQAALLVGVVRAALSLFPFSDSTAHFIRNHQTIERPTPRTGSFGPLWR